MSFAKFWKPFLPHPPLSTTDLDYTNCDSYMYTNCPVLKELKINTENVFANVWSWTIYKYTLPMQGMDLSKMKALGAFFSEIWFLITFYNFHYFCVSNNHATCTHCYTSGLHDYTQEIFWCVEARKRCLRTLYQTYEAENLQNICYLCKVWTSEKWKL